MLLYIKEKGEGEEPMTTNKWHKLKNIPQNEIVNLIKKKSSIKEIALELGVSKQAIYDYLKRHKFYVNKKIVLKKRRKQ